MKDMPEIMLQGHTDMVCAKNENSTHDFKKDPLQLYIKDGWIRAKETTLGADDGIAVAVMLALLDDDTIDHPSLSCLFTSAEELASWCGGFRLHRDSCSNSDQFGQRRRRRRLR